MVELNSNDINKIEYLAFYESKSLPIYFAPWWLDASCGDSNWDVVLAKNPNNEIEAIFVYHLKKYFGKPAILMPPMTSYSGIWYNYPPEIKNHSKISFEKKNIDRIVEKLPDTYFLFTQFHPEIQNWLPFSWKGFKQTTRYTYRIDLTQGTENIWNNFKGNVRRNVRKAEKKYKVVESEDFELFWNSLSKSYLDRSKKNPYTKEVFQKIHNACSKNECKSILLASDENDNIVAGAYLSNDRETAYYLAGFYLPEFDDYAALSLVMWASIQKMAKNLKVFDFEGSIIPEIETFFRSFGGELTPHYKLFKTKNALVRKLALFKNPKIFD